MRALIYAFVGLGAMSGFVVAYVSANEQDWLPALCGAALGFGWLVAAWLLKTSGRQAAALAQLSGELRALHERLDSIESLADLCSVEMDLARTGSGNPSRLVAASLERDAYPRIAADAPAEPFEASAEPPAKVGAVSDRDLSDGDAYLKVGAVSDRDAYNSDRDSVPPDPPRIPSLASGPPHGVSAGLWRRWQLAITNDDYPMARDALRPIGDLLGDDDLDFLFKELLVVSRSYVRRMRTRFGEQVRSGDFAGALVTGAALASSYPDSPMAAEFASIRPHLEAKLSPALKIARASAG